MKRILQLRRPKWDAVKKQYNANIKTRNGKIWAVIVGVVTVAMIAALIFPYSAVVHFFGGYGLACFFPTLMLLQFRKWNRTLAFPVALLFLGVAFMGFFGNISFNGFLTTMFLCVTFIIGATSDRLSPIYKWKPPFDHFGLVAVAFLLYLAVYFAFMFFTFAVFLLMFLIALVIFSVKNKGWTKWSDDSWHDSTGMFRKHKK